MPDLSEIAEAYAAEIARDHQVGGNHYQKSITLMEVLEITSDDLVERFVDKIEQKEETLENDLDDSTPWDND